MKKLIILLGFGCAVTASAQRSDTIFINAKNIHPEVLREGAHRYLVYFQRGEDAPRSDIQFWTINIKKETHGNRQVLAVDQVWDFKDTILHKAWSVCDAKTMQPLTHRTWWNIPKMGTTSVDFVNNTVEWNGSSLSDADTSKMTMMIWDAYKTARNKYLLNWHLDLEVFSMLPYREGAIFVIPFYDPGTRAPFENAVYTVKGSGFLTSYDGQQVDCWRLVLEEKGNKEVFWISKKTKEVLKLEQQFGKMFRHKIKLAFSS